MKELSEIEDQNNHDEHANIAVEDKPTSNLHHLITGATLALLSGFLFTAIHVFIQQFNLKFGDVSLVRYPFQMIVLLLIIKLPVWYRWLRNEENTNEESEGKNTLWIYQVDEGKNINVLRFLLVLQGLCNGVFTLGGFISVSRLPIGDFSVIIFSTPLPTMILSRIFLKIRLRLFKIACGFLLITGLLLVVRPTAVFGQNYSQSHSNNQRKTTDDFYFGVAAGLVGTLAGGVHFVLARVLYENKSSSSPLLLVFHAGLGLAAIFLDNEQQIIFPNILTITLNTWLQMMFVAVGGVIGFLMLNQAVKLTNPVIVSFIRVSEIVISYFIQIFWFKQPVDLLGIVGSVCVTLAVIIVPLENLVRNKLPATFKSIL